MAKTVEKVWCKLMFNTLSPQYNFGITIGGELVASARDIDFGEQLSMEMTRTFYGKTRAYPIGISADQIALSTLDISSPIFWNWLHAALNDHTMRKDIVITDNTSGVEYTLIGCVPVIISLPFNRESDEFVAQRVTLTAEGIRHSDEQDPSDQQVIKPSLGGIDLPATIKVKFNKEGEWSGDQSPHIEGDYSQYAGSKGKKLNVELTLTEDECNVAEIIDKLRALVDKDSGSDTPKIVRFVFAEIAIDVVVKSMAYDDMLRGYDGKLRMAKVELSLQERYIGDTSRTTSEQKGSQIYVVNGSGVTYNYIAWELWADESMSQAIRDYNPSPSAQGPVVPHGSVLIIPPWDYAEQYKRSGKYLWSA